MIELERLLRLWLELGDVYVDSDGRTERSFLHFPEGTHCEEIWHWFEAQNPHFIVGDMQQGKRPTTKFIDAFKSRFESFASEYAAGGCDTCGYTDERQMDEEDYQRLLAEIDEWIAKNFGRRLDA